MTLPSGPARARRLWMLAHRWLGLSLGIPLALVALLGALLVVMKPVDRWANATLFRVGHADTRGDLLETARQRLAGEFGATASYTFRPPREPGESLAAIVRGPWDGTVYMDPRDASELGRRGEHEGAFNLLFELHSSLLMEDTGKAFLAVVALSYLLMLATGLVLWWPKNWRRAWGLALDRGTLRGLFDLHRLGGSVLGLLIAVPVATGAYMAWRPLSGAVTSIAGDSARTPPKVSVARIGEGVQPLDAMVAEARTRFPGAMVGYVQIPAGPTRPARVRLKLADDPHPNGLTSVWMHPVSGEVLAVHRWNELDAGARGYSVIYPLHIGELGGPVHLVLNALLGLALFALGLTGLWLWALRHRH